MDSEEKYLDIREKLKNLEPVKAGDDFVYRLHHKIVELEAGKRKEHLKKFDSVRGGFLRNLFANRQYPWLIPAAGFLVLIFFVFYITYLSKNSSLNTESTLPSQKSEQEEKVQSAPSHPPSETNQLSGTNGNNEPGKSNSNEQQVTSQMNNSNQEKDNTSKKNISSDLKDEKKNKVFSDVGKDSNDKDNNDISNTIRTEPFAQKESENKVDAATYNNNSNVDLSKQNSSPEITENDGKVSMEKKSGESSKTGNNSEDNSKDSSKSVATEIESGNKKLIDKLNIINKTNLENLRDKVSDK